MKQQYTTPLMKVIDLTPETGMLTASGSQHRFEVGISQDAMNGSDALSNSKNEIWGNEDIWK